MDEKDKVVANMKHFKVITKKICANGSLAKFWKATTILLNNPHLINRRIAVSSEVLFVELVCNITEMVECIQATNFSFVHNFAENELEQKCIDLLNANKRCCYYERIESVHNLGELQNNKIYLRIAKLLPRDPRKFSLTIEVSLINKRSNSITFYSNNTECDKRSLGMNFSYCILYDEQSEISLSVEATRNDMECEANVIWLKDQLFPKFVKWVENEKPNASFLSGSLNLVSSENYILKYDELKKKYGPEMVKIWPESTDPQKFVHEDVAIATYLLLLWEQERNQAGKQQFQRFVDLGCGNGLLVHILTSEGHPGLGIDLRRRKIWDLFPESTRLEVRTIIPSASNVFPDTDWLIGNHSDELTPWIPVIAARSSYNCRFFLLPCCAYEFNGSKYQRDDASCSQYFEYMKYIRTVSEGCGFHTKIDKLRIPSTKRVCIVGNGRTYPRESYALQDVRINEIIHKRTGNGLNSVTKVKSENGEWSSDFKPRDVAEKVRNCTQVDKSLIKDIVNAVTSRLLSESHVITVRNNGVVKEWNAGCTIEIRKLAAMLAPEQLRQLKKECGGLQTLLKNNSYIFQVANGTVQLKNYTALSQISIPNQSKRRKLVKHISRKIKVCWFHENHPDGCPLSDEECNYRHEKSNAPEEVTSCK